MLERGPGHERGVHVDLVKIPFRPRTGLRRLPGLGTWSVTASRAARAALRRLEADGPLDGALIHTQVASLFSISFMRRVPTIVSLDATPLNLDAEGAAYGHRRNAEAIERLKLAVVKRSFQAAAGLVCWSHLAAASLEQDYGVPAGKIEVLPPGVDTSLFRPPDRPRVPGAPVKFLFVGGDFARKGGDDLLRALATVRTSVELDVVTSAPVESSPAGMTVRVHRGLKPQSPELVELFRGADVFALPTRGDCLPQVISEAMACALPVVATTVGALSEVVESGVNGFLVKPGDSAKLRETLNRLCADPTLRARLGAEGLTIARRDHDALRNNRRLLGRLHELAGAGRPLVGQRA